MKSTLPIFTLLLLGACVEPGPPEMTVERAEAFCTPQAQNFARSSFPVYEDGALQIGLLAETPDDFMVQDFYRRCVLAKSGQRPTADVKWRL